MLDMGFIPDIERICNLLSPARQTLFFSATMPPEIEKLTHKFLNAPERISVERKSMAASTIEQRLKATDPEPKAKRAALRELMRGEDVKNAIIFCNRKRDVGTVFRSLKKHGFNAGELHGDMDQRQRTLTLEGFRSGDITFLVASDVAARGLDIPAVSHVFNYDVPTHAEDYVHRIGRTGRAGREGYAATLVTKKETPALQDIEKLIGGPIEWLDAPPADIAEAQQERGRKRSGRQRSRKTPARVEDAVAGAPKAAPPDAEDAEAGVETPRPSRRRGRRGGRRHKAEAEALPAAGPAAGEQDGSRARGGGRDRRDQANGAGERKAAVPAQKRRKGATEDDLETADAQASDSTAFGMSDQVPAFLKRPIRRASSED